MANGDVSYCCYTDIYIGNLNREAIDDIWRGPALQRVRQQLAAQVYPEECKTLSCPLYNRHEYAHVLERMEGMYALELCGNADPHAAVRAALEGTCTTVHRENSGWRVALKIAYSGPSIKADIVAAVRSHNGEMRFLPRGDDFCVPAEVGLSLPEETADEIEVFSGEPPAEHEWGGGELCVALFLSGGLPTQAANCFWSQCLSLPAG